MSPQTIDLLSQRFANIAGVSFSVRNELGLIRIDNPSANAEILLQGAQLITFAPRNQQPAIWNSPLAGFKKGASSRGGIPVCWPWFGDAARNPDAVRTQLAGSQLAEKELPAHGFVRGIDWQLDAVNTVEDATEVVLSLDVDAATHPAWDFAARLVVTHRVGRTLTTIFSIENRDTRAFHFSTALHTYFAVSDIDSVSIEGFDGCRYIDALDDWKIKKQSDDVIIDREVDRVYLGTPSRSVIHDAGWQRDVIVEAQGSRSAVVWNPWTAKAKRLSDFAPDAYGDMLCIETANVMDDIVSLAAGATHRLGVAITCRKTSG
jgi:glucose-6-phosphate 1-epimerase